MKAKVGIDLENICYYRDDTPLFCHDGQEAELARQWSFNESKISLT